MQAALHLALDAEGASRTVKELARALDVPATYLTKVLQPLTHAGLLRAVRGPGGGVQLAYPADEMSLWDVLQAVEPAGAFDRCMLGLEKCGETEPCALHESWAPVKQRMVEMLRAHSLWEMANRASARGHIGGMGARDELPRRNGGRGKE